MSIQQSLLLPQPLSSAFCPHHDSINSQQSTLQLSCHPLSLIHEHEHPCSIISSPREESHSETTGDPWTYEAEGPLGVVSLVSEKETRGESSGQPRENDSSRRQQMLEQILQLKQQYKQKLEQQEAGRALCMQIATLEAQRLILYEKYSQSHLIYSQKYHDYCEIVADNEEIEEEIGRIDENIHYLQGEVPLLRKDCSQKLEERKRLEAEIRKFQAKKEELSLVLKAQNLALQKIIDQNLLIEEQIKFSREEYETFQQKIYDLDQKGENLKKYGCQTVNASTVALFSQRERLQSQLIALQEQISCERKTIQKMISIDKTNKLKAEIDKLETMKAQKSLFQSQNRLLKEENQRLGEVKYSYEWNPNLEIKNLENSQAEKETKIANIQNDINLFKKQATEIQQKIDDFEYYLRSSETSSPPENSDSSLGSPRRHQREKILKKQKSQRMRPLYESIKQEIEQNGVKKDSNFTFWKNIFSRNQQTSPEIIQIDAFTYRVNKRKRLWEIVSVFVVLMLMVWGCFIIYKR